jgi:formylglycine-generating enzyme required for sulfatase activity
MRSSPQPLALLVSAMLLAVYFWMSCQSADCATSADSSVDFQAYDEVIPGSKVRFTMMPIPEGKFLMGSPQSEIGRNPDEGPQHPVAIPAFWMGKTEVTWDEYDCYRKERELPERPESLSSDGDSDAVSRPTPPYADETFGYGRERHPALCMTHHAAMDYCHWLSEKTGKTYRLPTEAEWEYACRAGSKTAYFFGNDPKDLGGYAWYSANCSDDNHQATHEVATKKPNGWGLFDMYGNVAEWCLDSYAEAAYSQFPADRLSMFPVVLPTAARFPDVVRGGSWADGPKQLRSASRRSSDKSWIKRDPNHPQSIWWLTDADFVGFRIVRPVVEQDKLKGVRSRVTWESK